MLTEWLRREELKTEFLELRSKMRDIYLSWNVSSSDQVGRKCFDLSPLTFIAAVDCGQPAGFEHISLPAD